MTTQPTDDLRRSLGERLAFLRAIADSWDFSLADEGRRPYVRHGALLVIDDLEHVLAELEREGEA